MSKNKKHNKKRYSKNNNKESKVKNPRSFFKRIGIKPPINKQKSKDITFMGKEISKRLGLHVADTFLETYKSGHHENDSIYYSHSYLPISKLWYEEDFNRICRIATELMQLTIPSKLRILDIGGGPGHLAFWMAHIWPDCEITVADKFSKTGVEWAKEIGEDRVSFVDATLPDLSPLKGQKYDMILMSRVLGFSEELNFPSFMNTFTSESYFNSDEAKDLFCKLEKMAESIYNHLNDDGMLVVIDSWSDFRVLVVGRAFERKGLFINLNLFSPDRISIEHSTIVFTKSIDSKPCQDLPLGLSALWDFKDEKTGMAFTGNLAEGLRNVFRDVPIVFESKHDNDADGITFKHEILEIEGLSLLYITDTGGRRLAILGSAISIPQRIKFLQGFHK